MKLWTCVWVLCAAVCVACGQQRASDEDWLDLDTPQGPVRGRKDPEADHLYVFYNIPYATAPINENKFKPPLPPPTWTKPFNAVDEFVICPQSLPEKGDDKLKKFVPKEDCLIANIYVPDTPAKNLSVLVDIHGGGFGMGYGNINKAKHFLEKKDIVLVNFNYRLGVHGFLCLGTEDIPGNAGIKDQVALLHWVQNNIASYGGNPNDVTVAGFSAGSVSVDLLMLSKLAEGLFHKAIPESGGNLAVFAIQRNPLAIARSQARRLNFTGVDDISALEQFYKTAPMSVLISNLRFERPDFNNFFSPCVERETANEPFLTESSLSLLQKGNYKKIPILYGFANMEGLLRIRQFETWKDKMNEKFSVFLPIDLKFKTAKEKKEVAEKIKKFYFGDKPVGNDNILEYLNFYSDLFAFHPMLWAVKLRVEAGHKEIYLYDYSFVDEDTPVVPHTNVRGAGHCAQTMALMDGRNGLDYDESNLTSEFRNMKKIIREIWHNFVKTGKPVPEGSSLPAWPATGANWAPSMSLGQTVELRDEPLLQNHTIFWQDIYQKHYRDPIPPPKAQLGISQEHT